MGGAIAFFLLFCGIGGLFTWFGFSKLLTIRDRRRNWVALEGSVTGLEERPGNEGDTLYAPVFSYTVNGREVTKVSDVASTPPAYRVGDRIRLLVDPRGRKDPMVADKSLWIFSCGLLAMGLVCLAAGLLFSGLMLWDRLK